MTPGFWPDDGVTAGKGEARRKRNTFGAWGLRSPDEDRLSLRHLGVCSHVCWGRVPAGSCMSPDVGISTL